jgi:hypothetical protein
VEIVTVCLDAAGPEAAMPYVEAAQPDHPTLIDVENRLDAALGIVNVPNGVWIDEDGVIVRPPEPAWPARPPAADARRLPEGTPERFVRMAEEASRIQADPEAYVTAVRDWAAHGAESSYALPPHEVVARSRERSPERATAAAHFALAEHLHRAGEEDAAVGHFKAAHRLDPDNWLYRRQAWSLRSPIPGPIGRLWQGPVEGHEDEWPYEGDWLADVERSGAESYYPPFRP